MVRRRIVFPKETWFAFMLAKVDLANWLKGVVGKHGARGISVKGSFREQYIKREENPVFELESQDPKMDEILDKLHLEIDSRIYEVFTSLTDREKMVLRMRVQEDRSLAQIALEMEVKPQTVVSFIDSIKKKVKKITA